MQSYQYDVIFTFRKVKNIVRITAIDEITKKEVTVCAPESLDREEMKKLSLKKLAYVLRKNTEQ